MPSFASPIAEKSTTATTMARAWKATTISTIRETWLTLSGPSVGVAGAVEMVSSTGTVYAASQGPISDPPKRSGRSATLQNVQVPLVREVPQDLTHAEWLRACEASYPKVDRALVAMGTSPEDAADALQDAFEDAVRERGAIARPDGWLFVVACRAWKRHRWRHRLFRPLDALRCGVQIASRDDEIDLLVELAKLTERQRAVMVSRYVLGLSQAETADLLETNDHALVRLDPRVQEGNCPD